MPQDVLALFDLDHTLLPHDTDEQWVEFLLARGVLERSAFEAANRDLAARYFGIAAWAAHANGVVDDARGPTIWFARRSAGKSIDPGRLDNLVGGGIAAGEAPDATLHREAWEEAGVPPAVARSARRVGALHVERCGPDGFQRETIVAYDLALPAQFVPASQDGEAVEHRRVGRAEALRLIAQEQGPDVVTIDASLVVLDWLARQGAVPPGSLAHAVLDRVRVAPPDAA